MKKDPLTPEFWREYAASIGGKEDARFTSPEFWNRVAETYDDLEASSFYRQMVEEIIETMKIRGALGPKLRVFDVCCGPGNYALQFAPLVKEVVALDISPKMIEKCRKKAREAGVSNIRIILGDWFKFETKETFDTVFVSMSPIIHHLDSIDRLLSLSRRFLILVHWAGVRKNLLYARIYKEVFDRELVWKRPGIIVVFNYLYTLGYAGDIRFFTGYWERLRPIEKELEQVLWRLEREGISVSKEAKEKILRILEEESRGGLVPSRTKVRIGFLFVDLSLRALPT